MMNGPHDRRLSPTLFHKGSFATHCTTVRFGNETVGVTVSGRLIRRELDLPKLSFGWWTHARRCRRHRREGFNLKRDGAVFLAGGRSKRL